MTEILDTVYRLRVLRGRLEAGVGLEMAEIQLMESLEREATKARTNVAARLTNGKYADQVTVGVLGQSDVLCHGCPWLEIGDVVEIAIEHEARSYRFKARVSWCGEDASGDLDAVLAFVGVPVMLRRGPKSQPAPSLAQRVAA